MTMLETAPADSQLIHAPDVAVTSSDGMPRQLASLWAERPLVLVFLPPTGTEFRIDNATQLRDARETYAEAGASMAAIVATSPQDAASFRRQYHLEYTLLCDGDRALHAAFGLGAADAHGSFVIDTTGAIRYAHRGSDASDYPPTAVLAREVCAITGAVLKTPPEELLARAPSATEFVAPVSAVGVASGAFTCPKCGSGDYDVSQMSTAGGIWSRIFNFQYRRFSAVTCKRCTYTELYKAVGSKLANVLDIVAGR